MVGAGLEVLRMKRLPIAVCRGESKENQRLLKQSGTEVVSGVAEGSPTGGEVQPPDMIAIHKFYTNFMFRDREFKILHKPHCENTYTAYTDTDDVLPALSQNSKDCPDEAEVIDHCFPFTNTHQLQFH